SARPASSTTSPYRPRRLHQPQRGKLGAKRRWQLVPRAGPEIGRSVLGLVVAPALEGPFRLPFGRHQRLVEHQAAALDAFAIGEDADVEQPLADLDVALDHPVERAAVEELVPAL